MNIKITPEIFTQYVENRKNIIKMVLASDEVKRSDLVVSNAGTKIIFNNNFLQSVEYSEPQRLDSAVFILKNNPTISDELFLLSKKSYYNLKELSKEIVQSDKFKDVKVKSLIGVGARALVFETEDGKVLKLVKGNHFKQERLPQEFDIPIEKSGKLLPDGKFYYYLEEKTTQGDITKAEVKSLLKQAKKLGYRFVDYREEDLYCGKINFSQFGRAKNGKVYLIDPECAVKSGKLEPIISFLKVLFRI